MMYRAMWVHEQLDIEYIERVMRLLIGEKDFSSFCKKRDSKNINTVRRIVDISVRKIGDLIEIEISGNAFLHNMIRIIVGTVVEMNKNRTDPDALADIIAKRDRDCSGVTAPPYGLYLAKVRYEPGLDTVRSAF
jgi:tRNA pseudouridine38-40 synthase